MLITKFNRMIRNKFIWTIVATVVSVSFVLSFSSMRGCSAQAVGEMGTLMGEPVTFNEYRLAERFELNFADRGSLSVDQREVLDDFVWRRLALLRLADEFGLQAPDAEITDWVTRQFSVNGAFDQSRYLQFLAQQRLPVSIFEMYLRQDLTLQRVSGIIGSLSWIGPSELNWQLRNLTDNFTLNYAILERDGFDPDIALSDEELRTYFEENTEEFKTPPMRTVKYVSFPLNAYEPGKIGFAAVSNYYGEHSTDFLTIDTNGVASVLALEDAYDRVEAKLGQEQQVSQAVDDATEFLVSLQPRYGRGTTPIEDVAGPAGKSVLETQLFTIDSPPRELGIGVEFAEEAFELDNADPHLAFSKRPFVGRDAVYVIAAGRLQPSRVPELDAVKANVMSAATRDAREKAFSARADEVHERLVASAASNLAFAAVVSDFGLEPVTNVAFSLYENLVATNGFAYTEAIQSHVPTMHAGMILDPIALPQDILLVHVEDRSPALPSERTALRPELIRTLQQSRSGMLYQVLGKHLLAHEGPTASAPTGEPEAPSEETATPGATGES